MGWFISGRVPQSLEGTLHHPLLLSSQKCFQALTRMKCLAWPGALQSLKKG